MDDFDKLLQQFLNEDASHSGKTEVQAEKTEVLAEKTELMTGKTHVFQGTAVSGGGVSSSPDAFASGAEADLYIEEKDGRTVVRKVWHSGMKYNEDVLARLDHLAGRDYIADILDYGRDSSGRCYEITPYYPLGAASAAGIRGNAEAIISIVSFIALALDECHAAGVLHKDVKPANILIADKINWNCVLCDWGIADILKDGKVTTLQSRTPIYAAPEVYDPDNTVVIDGRTWCSLTGAADFYSLGMTALSLWYGESAFRSKEAELALQKTKGHVRIPDSMPEPLATIVRGLLVRDPEKRWGFQEICDCIDGKDVPVGGNGDAGDLDVVFNAGGRVYAHTPSELARCMRDDPELGRRYLYRGRIREWLRPLPELETTIDEIVEVKYPKNQHLGLLASIFALDPLMDLTLCDDTRSPSYAMTQESIGRILNAAYNIWFQLYEGFSELMEEEWDGTKEVLGVRLDASMVKDLVSSFYQYEGSYLQLFFKSKGSRFASQDSWVRYCTDYTAGDLARRAGPKDDYTRAQIAMMKTIKGFGFAPVLCFRDGTSANTVNSLSHVGKGQVKASLGGGLKGFLAVQYQDNPDADFSAKYSYERQLESYVGRLGMLDSQISEYKRFTQARKTIADFRSSFTGKARKSRAGVVLRLVLAIMLVLFPSVCLLLWIISSLRFNAVLDLGAVNTGNAFWWCSAIIGFLLLGVTEGKGGCLGELVIGALITFLIGLAIRFLGRYAVWLFLLAAAAHLAFVLFALVIPKKRNKASSPPRAPDFEENTVEPLYYAFSDEAVFDSSYIGSIPAPSNYASSGGGSLWALTIVSLVLTWLLLFAATFLPVGGNPDVAEEEQIQTGAFRKRLDTMFERTYGLAGKLNVVEPVETEVYEQEMQ